MIFVEGIFSYIIQFKVTTALTDSFGTGAFSDIRHYLWLMLIPLLAITGYKLFKKNQRLGITMISILAIMLFTVRFSNQTYRAITGIENPWTQAFPFHMCTVLTFLLPLTILFKWKKIQTPVYVLSIMGGIITALIGDYFDTIPFTYFGIEGISAHTLLIILPIYQIAVGKFKLEFRNSYSVFIGILVLMGWATLANEVFYVGLDPNYMYLRHNALPGDFGKENFFLVYVAIFFIFYLFIFGIPTIHRIMIQQKESHLNLNQE